LLKWHPYDPKGKIQEDAGADRKTNVTYDLGSGFQSRPTQQFWKKKKKKKKKTEAGN
jgi:hypothetical protein